MAEPEEKISAICSAAASGADAAELERQIAGLLERAPDPGKDTFARGGPAGALLRAEIVRRNGDRPSYLAALAEIPAEPIATDPALASLAALARSGGREHAMREWRRGHVEASLEMLDALARLWPDDLDLAADRLRVLVLNRIEDQRTRATIENLSDAAWRHRRIALLATLFHTRKSDITECLNASARWATADTGSIDGLERWGWQASLTISFQHLLVLGAAGPDGGDVREATLDSKPLRALARALLLLPRDLREFQDQIFHLVQANELSVPEPFKFFAAVLEELAKEDVPAEFLGQILAFLIAYSELPRAAPLAERVRQDETLLSCPHLAKFLCLYAQLAGDRRLEGIVLAKILRDDLRPEDQRGYEAAAARAAGARRCD